SSTSGAPATRINIAGDYYTDVNLDLWDSEVYTSGGSAKYKNVPIAQTEDDELYKTYRAGNNIRIDIPLTSGDYELRLHFMEPGQTSVGSRVFDIQVEGSLAFDDVDVYALAGDRRTALVLSQTVTLSDGELNIKLTREVNSPVISAVEVIPLSGEAPVPDFELRVNSGGPAYTDAAGYDWLDDQAYIGGDVFSTSDPIQLTVDDSLYQTERWASYFEYEFPVDNGTYEVTLHFAEIYFTANNKRIFDVFAEGQLIIDDLDIHSLVGADSAYLQQFTVPVSDGTLNVEFLGVVNNAKISAVEIRRAD
ncbi:MAG: hypothetical protein KDD66_17345, partial [Bdellovibrionales bacterium]|nr:hypothetical protein [Bdellovibrionales bacterium]